MSPRAVPVLRLRRGTLKLVIASGAARDAVLVESEQGAAALLAEGTTTLWSDGKEMRVASLDSEQPVYFESKSHRVPAGEIRVFRQHQPVTASTYLQGARPVVPPGLILVGEGTPPLHLEWPPVAGAKDYRVVIRSRSSQRLVMDRTMSSTSLDWTPTTMGSLEVNVQPTDEHGIEGHPGEPGTVNLLGVSLPAGAVSDAGVVWLPPRTRLGLVGNEEFEVTYGDSDYFVPAPPTLGLSRGHAVKLRLRHVGNLQSYPLELRPLAATAEVSLSPRLARWPGGEVLARIRSRAANSKRELEGLVAEITINGNPVEVTWEPTEDGKQARIPPAQSDGPWVVRIALRTREGVVVSRDFVEVALGLSDLR